MPKQETNTTLGQLPIKYGEKPNDRVMYFYKKFFFGKFTVHYRATSIVLERTKLKELLSEFAEDQILLLLVMHFNWYGGDGNNIKEYNYMSSAFFPLALLVKKRYEYIIYLKNKLNIDINNHDDILKYFHQNRKMIFE